MCAVGKCTRSRVLAWLHWLGRDQGWDGLAVGWTFGGHGGSTALTPPRACTPLGLDIDEMDRLPQ